MSGEFASKGVAGTALGFGIGGTALALLNGNNGCGNGGLLGGLLGGNRNCAPCEPLETKESSCLRQQVATLQAEKYADGVGISTFKESLALITKNQDAANALFREGFQGQAATEVRLATSDANIACITSKLAEVAGTVKELAKEACEAGKREVAINSAVNALAADTKAAIALEAERRHCADEATRCWVKGTYVPGTLSMSPDSMCPKPVTCCDVLRYANNGGAMPVPSPCSCGCKCGAAAAPTA